MNKALLSILLAVAAVVSIAASLLMMGDADGTLHYILLIVFVPLMLVGAYMAVTGKGSMLVAGYNTSSPEKRAEYDENKLTRTTGLVVFVICILMLLTISSFLYFEDMWIGLAMMMAASVFIVFALVYMNTGDRMKRPYVETPTIPDGKRNRRRNVAIAAAAVTVLVIGITVVALMTYGDVSAELEDERLTVKAPMVDRSVAYSDISSVELREGMDTGSRVNGFGTFKISSGTFRNAEFGNYTLASYGDVGVYVIVYHGDDVLAFNLDSDERTRAFYAGLSDIVSRS